MVFFLNATRLLNRFGTDIKVWPADSQQTQAYPGAPTDTVDLSDDKAQKRHEPVLPLNTNSAIGRRIIAGGGTLEGKLVWYSDTHYPTGSIVYVPTQLGYYKITDFGEYNPYSHFWEYILQGDDHDGLDENAETDE